MQPHPLNAVEPAEKTAINLGFIPLTDCAPLVVAKEKGYFAKYGLNVTLSRETSWSNVRDKVAIGLLDGAQMLAPMPLAMSLGIGPMACPMVTALSLGLNGNAITVSSTLYEQMRNAEPMAMATQPLTAHALKRVLTLNKLAGKAPLTFATVFPFSSHNYELRYWMASAGIDPDKDVRLLVIPPPQMADSLRQGLIDGYCVGEPWNSIAVEAGYGRILISKYEIWNNSPEKVLGHTAEWVTRHPNTHRRLLMALLEAVHWLDAPHHRAQVATLIASPDYVNAPEEMIRMSMQGLIHYSDEQPPHTQPDFNVFHRYAANYPWHSHAIWFLTQMVRWGQLPVETDLRRIAEAVYRPDLYQQASKALGVVTPHLSYKTEGYHRDSWHLYEGEHPIAMGADGFFDGMPFDPFAPHDYLAGFTVAAEQEQREARLVSG